MLVVPVVLLVLGVVVASALPVPYVRLSPGPTFNVIGTVDGTPLITIEGTTTYPTAGHLDMTTVSESGGPVGRLTLGDALRGWVDPVARVVPIEQLYPEDATPEQVKEESQVAFSDSQSDAVAAALRHLDIPVATLTVVSQVQAGAPADGRLEAGDVLVSLDGTKVSSPKDVGAAVRAKPVGTTFSFVVRRDGATRTVEVTSAARPEKGTPYLGILTGITYRGPFTVDFALDDVGGPSAGTMFALGIVDKLTPGELNGGRFVAGTGTITAEGEVGPIGGIEQKMVGARRAGAELFLAPESNCDAVVGNVPEGLVVTPMATLDDAVARVEAFVAGQTLPTCPGS